MTPSARFGRHVQAVHPIEGGTQGGNITNHNGSVRWAQHADPWVRRGVKEPAEPRLDDAWSRHCVEDWFDDIFSSRWPVTTEDARRLHCRRLSPNLSPMTAPRLFEFVRSGARATWAAIVRVRSSHITHIEGGLVASLRHQWAQKYLFSFRRRERVEKGVLFMERGQRYRLTLRVIL
jgi:hypothetical protein